MVAVRRRVWIDHCFLKETFQLWDEEYQRRKKYSREVVIGGRHRRNMTTLTVNTPTDLNARKWASRLNKEYNRLAMTQSVREFFDGVRQRDQHGSENLAAARTAETATWGLNERTIQPSTERPFPPQGRDDNRGRRSWRGRR